MCLMGNDCRKVVSRVKCLCVFLNDVTKKDELSQSPAEIGKKGYNQKEYLSINGVN